MCSVKGYKINYLQNAIALPRREEGRVAKNRQFVYTWKPLERKKGTFLNRASPGNKMAIIESGQRVGGCEAGERRTI